MVLYILFSKLSKSMGWPNYGPGNQENGIPFPTEAKIFFIHNVSTGPGV